MAICELNKLDCECECEFYTHLSYYLQAFGTQMVESCINNTNFIKMASI